MLAMSPTTIDNMHNFRWMDMCGSGPLSSLVVGGGINDYSPKPPGTQHDWLLIFCHATFLPDRNGSGRPGRPAYGGMINRTIYGQRARHDVGTMAGNFVVSVHPTKFGVASSALFLGKQPQPRIDAWGLAVYDQPQSASTARISKPTNSHARFNPIRFFMTQSPSRSGVFQAATDKRLEAFSESISFDHRLYEQDIRGSLAHARMLCRQKMITADELSQIETAMAEIKQLLDAGQLPFRQELEDIHMHIEQALIERLGDVGRKLHTGRSRNDQVSRTCVSGPAMPWIAWIVHCWPCNALFCRDVLAIWM